MDLQRLLRGRGRGPAHAGDLPLIALLAMLGCGPSAPTAKPGPKPEPTVAEAPAEVLEAVGGSLLFATERGEAIATYRIDASGARERPVLGPPDSVYPGEADPLGTHVLLVSASDGPQGHAEQLWLAPVAGGAAQSLCPPAAKVRNPSWAPDGSWVAFESDAMSFRDLFRVQRDGTGLARLTEAEHGSFEPAVSPDGQRIAFGTSRDGNAEIYVMAADGSGPERITEHAADDVRPRWSPDGRVLAWASGRSGRMRVHVRSEDGQVRALRAGEGVDLDHAWSPDGEHLAITVQTGPTDIAVEVVAWPGGEVVGRLDGPGVDEQPAWSPDGRWIAWTSGRDGAPAVYLAHPDGSQLRRLTTGRSDWLPRWLRPVE